MKQGVLLINLGTPQAPKAQQVKEFLKPFLLDKRVVDINPLIWYPLLNFIILPKRSPIVANIYKQIWMDDGSPLLVHTQDLAHKLQQQLNTPVEVGMTYGEPCINSGIERLIELGVTQIKVLPLYPQYSTTTTLAAWDQIDTMQERYPQLEFIRIQSYANKPPFIQALVESIQEFWNREGEPQALLCSYHGIPQRYTKEKGDPYAHICAKNTLLLATQLRFDEDKIFHSYQSRFGREPWLMPYTEQEIQRLARSGIKRLDIITPSFACDCLETLYEIQELGNQQFQQAGGKELRLIPCLNDSQQHIALCTHLINCDSVPTFTHSLVT